LKIIKIIITFLMIILKNNVDKSAPVRNFEAYSFSTSLEFEEGGFGHE